MHAQVSLDQFLQVEGDGRLLVHSDDHGVTVRVHPVGITDWIRGQLASLPILNKTTVLAQQLVERKKIENMRVHTCLFEACSAQYGEELTRVAWRASGRQLDDTRDLSNKEVLNLLELISGGAEGHSEKLVNDFLAVCQETELSGFAKICVEYGYPFFSDWRRNFSPKAVMFLDHKMREPLVLGKEGPLEALENHARLVLDKIDNRREDLEAAIRDLINCLLQDPQEHSVEQVFQVLGKYVIRKRYFDLFERVSALQNLRVDQLSLGHLMQKVIGTIPEEISEQAVSHLERHPVVIVILGVLGHPNFEKIFSESVSPVLGSSSQKEVLAYIRTYSQIIWMLLLVAIYGDEYYAEIVDPFSLRGKVPSMQESGIPYQEVWEKFCAYVDEESTKYLGFLPIEAFVES